MENTIQSYFATEYDSSYEPESIDSFKDVVGDVEVFNQNLTDDILNYIDAASIDLGGDWEEEIVGVLIDIWRNGELPHTISDYINPKVLVGTYNISQEELDKDREEYLDTLGYTPLDNLPHFFEK